MTLPNEKKMVKKAQKDSVYFAPLYKHYFPKIRAYIGNMVSSQTVADDLTSATFEKAVEKIDLFQWKGISFGSWLYRIARNKVYDYFRSARRRRTSQLSQEAEDSIRSKDMPEAAVLHDERELKLYETIAELDKTDQYLLYYRYFERWSVRKIAQKTGLSEANVATRLHRIRAKMKDIWG